MAAKTARKRHRNVANPELAAAMRDLRRSSAAQPHVRADRKGSRAAHKRAAIASY